MPSVPVRYRRAEKGLFAQKLQHAIPSFAVLGHGVDHLQHAPRGASLALGLAEVSVSVLVMGSVVRGFRQMRAKMTPHAPASRAHHGVDWIDLCLAAMLGVEADARFHANGNIARPTILLAALMVGLGLGHGRLAAWGDRRRELRVTDEGVSIPGRFFKRLTLAWPEVAEVVIGHDKARLIAVDGRDQPT